MEKRWRLKYIDNERAESLQHHLKVHKVLCGILVQRGITTYEEARKYFRPSLADLHDPFLMKDMHVAVERIDTAIRSHERILVFGDYDVDGTTSVACMYSFLKSIHPLTEFYIPHRYREGYGISQAGIDFARENGYTLIVSLDCGIKSIELIRYAKNLGIDFIVCDHHLPDEVLPPAVAILNPKQVGCPYPYKELCGCGVGFKLISALCIHFELPQDRAHDFLDLVATAIAADIVPITGENRVLSYYGLKKANTHPNFGIRALSYLSNFNKDFQINNLVFIIAPRVNAAGRMDEGRKAVMMFIADSYDEALHWAETLHTDNASRRETDSSITTEALALIQSDEDFVQKKTTVLYQPHWHKGVVGIVASRMIDHFYRPTIILTQSGDYVAGSARSVSGFNVYEAVHQCRDLLIGYGGHFYAAGLTLTPDNVPAFSKRFEEVVDASIHPELLIPEVTIDAELSFADIRKPFFEILNQMEPFGPENQAPCFLVKQVYNTGWSKVVKDAHIRFVLQQNDIKLTGIGFQMADKMPLLESGAPVDIVFRIEENEWKSEKNLQLKIVDFRKSAE